MIIDKLSMQKLLLLSVFLSLHFLSSSSSTTETDEQTTKLFVFGDSYADTGNWNKSIASAWKVPYGITYPGKPAGRFSDGRILTDFIASYLQIKSPIPYEEWNLLSGSTKTKKGEFGMNFAYGGTGVFDTDDVSCPNFTTQIDIFEHLINQSQVYLNNSSIGFVCLGGNDYGNLLKHPTNLTVPEFTKSMINQLVVDFERIHSLGLQKIIVTTLEPLGCLPSTTFYSGYKKCIPHINKFSSYHNMILKENVDLLNKKTKADTFITLDLYGAFMSSLQPGNLQNLEGRLEPCCKGVTTSYECGSIEANVTKYTLCEKPDKAFFWDEVHLTQNGWYQVFMAVQPALAGILNTKVWTI